LDAALALIGRRTRAEVTLAEIARAARLSRQAIYLHFADRAALFVALVQHVDERRGLAAEITRVVNAPSGVDALKAMVATQARLNPSVWPIARAIDAMRRTDAALERAWQDGLANRLRGCRAIVDRMVTEGTLRSQLDADVAADLLWSMTSLRAWEDLVLERGWTAAQYEARITAALLSTLSSR